MNTERLNNFRRWWKKNHHKQTAHKWLVKHSKRTMHNYNIAPEQFDHCRVVMKRWNLSEFKRLNHKDAQFLWRLIHPTMNVRRQRLLSSAAYFQAAAEGINRKFSR